jgi:hypothetical protein
MNVTFLVYGSLLIKINPEKVCWALTWGIFSFLKQEKVAVVATQSIAKGKQSSTYL